jgi:hypothetical protein
MSSTALTIWTQVAPFMPPMATYTIIRRPTSAAMPILLASVVMPSSNETRMPAPAIWATSYKIDTTMVNGPAAVRTGRWRIG